jgi:hypothetical protein
MKTTSGSTPKFGLTLSGRFQLRAEFGWALFAAMVLSCLCLSLVDLPGSWRVLQNVAALVQAFASGVIAAQWLPIWEAAPEAPGQRIQPSAD